MAGLEKKARFPTGQVNKNLCRGSKSQRRACYIHAYRKSFGWELYKLFIFIKCMVAVCTRAKLSAATMGIDHETLMTIWTCGVPGEKKTLLGYRERRENKFFMGVYLDTRNSIHANLGLDSDLRSDLCKLLWPPRPWVSKAASYQCAEQKEPRAGSQEVRALTA